MQTGLTQKKADELILYVLGGMINEKVSSDINSNVLERFFIAIGKYINKLFGKNTNLNYFGPRLTLEDMADWLLYGNGSMKLVAPSSKIETLVASKSILDQIGSVGIAEANNGYLNFSDIATKRKKGTQLRHSKDLFQKEELSILSLS